MKIQSGAEAYRQAAQVLPRRLRQEALGLPQEEQEQAEELRLRVGWPMTAVLPEDGGLLLIPVRAIPKDVRGRALSLLLQNN